MYPCGSPHPGEVFQDAASDRQSLDLIFYDPIPSIGSEKRTSKHILEFATTAQEQEHRTAIRGSEVARKEAIEAVVRDLARLTTVKTCSKDGRD